MQAAVKKANIDPGHVNDALIGNVLAELGFAKTGRITTTYLPISSLSAQCSAQATQGGLGACSELLSGLNAVRGEYQNRKGKPSMF